jgi:hypothetical protein
MKDLEAMEQDNPQNSGSSEDFFNAIEAQVNGAIIDNDQQPQDNPQVQSDPAPQATHAQAPETPTSKDVDWEKRYRDSSREATRMRQELNRLQPFVPVLDVMAQDSGLVDTVKDYLEGGGKPAKNVQEQLGLDEDFIFDAEEAMNNPTSDSAKVFNAQVDKIVSDRVNSSMQVQNQQVQQDKAKAKMRSDAKNFMDRHGMSEKEFSSMMADSRDRQLTLDDIYYLLNKDKSSSNVAKATQQGIVNQMKNVQNLPTSVAGINTPRAEVSVEDTAFDAILDHGTSLDDIFNG